MTTYSLRQQAALTVLLFGMLLLLVPRAGHGGDVHYWYTWACYIFDYGLGNVYQVPDNNYNPLYHYILWAFGKLAGSKERIDHYRHWLKAFTLVFDFAGAFWAASLVGERERRFGLVLVLLFNIGYLYNTLIWEQVDAIYTFFAFGAVVLAVQQRSVASLLCFVLALAAKTQAIIFLPPLLLLWAPQWWRRPSRLLLGGVGSAALLALLLAPFIWFGYDNYVPRIVAINLGATEVYPVVFMGAFNFWCLLPTHLSLDLSDATVVAGLSYRGWGLGLFCGSSALALLPLLLATARQLRAGPRAAVAPFPTPLPPPALPATDLAPDLALTLLSCGLIPLLFCFFNTQMHERYWHAAILFLAAYAFLRRDYLPYGLASAAYFLNLEGVLRYLNLLKYTSFFLRPWFSAALFALTIIICLVKLYRLATLRAARQGRQLGAAPKSAESSSWPVPA
ncbi:hypothetical protein [uncultured Hymenobacter sp.]|uniref:hypothetical protein n=1 Tax=uncultured Hymenobacter sp. TaxID=170016 RepID=UPI0035C9C233